MRLRSVVPLGNLPLSRPSLEGGGYLGNVGRSQIVVSFLAFGFDDRTMAMTRERLSRFAHFLQDMPFVSNGVFTKSPADRVYELIKSKFIAEGFRIDAEDIFLLRFCAYRFRLEHGKCSCIYVFWVRRNGHLNYISFGVYPKYWSFWFCGYGDHLSKMYYCRSTVLEAIGNFY